MLVVRRADSADVEQLLDIAAAGRAAHEEYQPQFWRSAPDAVDRQRDYLRSLLDDDETLVLAVTEDGVDVRGFAIGRLVPAPPVYDPGGATCLVDDFAVADPGQWPTLGPLLLDALRSWAVSRGAAQLVAVTAHLDEAKKAVLRGSGLDLASEWWVQPVGGL